MSRASEACLKCTQQVTAGLGVFRLEPAQVEALVMMRREGTVRRMGKVGGGADVGRRMEESKRARDASTSDAI